MLLFRHSSLGTCLAVSHSPTSVHSDFPSAGLHFYFPLSILYFLFLFALEVTFSCPSLVCLGIFAEVQSRHLLYFPCLQSTLTPSCLELLPLDAPRAAPPLPWGREWGAHESGHKGWLAIVSQLTFVIVSSLYFPQSQKEAPNSKPLAPHQGVLLSACKFGSYQEFSSPWTLQAGLVSAALQRGSVCWNFFHRLTPNTSSRQQ